MKNKVLNILKTLSKTKIEFDYIILNIITFIRYEIEKDDFNKDMYLNVDTSIIYSGLKTPDGTIIESNYRHDYVTYDDKNGKTYVIDGGLDYVRCSNNGDEETITIYANETFEKVREYAFRGGFGKTGNEEYRITRIKDMDDEYLFNAIQYIFCIAPYSDIVLKDNTHFKLLINELIYRNK